MLFWIGVEARDRFEAAVLLPGRDGYRAERLRWIEIHPELVEFEVLAREDLLHPRGSELADELGGKRWQYDRWYHLILGALAGTPDQFPRDYHSSLAKPAMLRYGATSPAMLRWMKEFNKGKTYDAQVKPYGFMVGFLHRAGGAFAEDWHAELIEEVGAGAPPKEKRVRPIAAFDRDPAKAVANAFDRDTEAKVDPSELRTYAEALALYHVSAEEKFENGGPADVGPTRRRHLHFTRIGLIGKEANQVGETGEEDPESEAVVEFSR